MRTIILPIKRKWFDMILAGEKKEEYREIKSYWASRLLSCEREMEFQVFDEMINDMRHPFSSHLGVEELMYYFGVKFKTFDAVLFKNGYSQNSPAALIQINCITISQGLKQWGAEPGIYYFTFKLGTIR